MSANEQRYTMVGRCIDGVNILGYAIQDKTTQQISLMDKATVDQLAITKQIENVVAQNYDGKILLKGKNCKLNELPNYNPDGSIYNRTDLHLDDNEDIIVSARITKSKATVGYVISLRRNGVVIDRRSITKEGLVKLAKDGNISNVRVQLSNKTPILRGVNFELAKLPIYRQDEIIYN